MPLKKIFSFFKLLNKLFLIYRLSNRMVAGNWMFKVYSHSIISLCFSIVTVIPLPLKSSYFFWITY
jgi:hypothetical protein